MVYHSGRFLLKPSSTLKGDDMSDSKKIFEEKLEVLAKGLFTMSKDRARALSNHETVDLIEELRAAVAELQAEANKL